MNVGTIASSFQFSFWTLVVDNDFFKLYAKLNYTRVLN